MKWRKAESDAVRRKSAARMDRLSEAEILDWADSCGSSAAKSLMDYRKEREDPVVALAEAQRAVSALQGVLDALAARQ